MRTHPPSNGDCVEATGFVPNVPAFKTRGPRPRSASVARFLLIAGLAIVFQTIPARSQQNAIPEYEVKAAFLYSLASFVEWPPRAFPDANAPFIIGVLGNDPFGGALERTVQSGSIQNRRVLIRRGRSIDEMRQCNLVFVCRSESGHLGSVISALRGSSILTVGDSDQFAAQGGVINFVMEGDRVRFEINLGAAKRADLKISSRLLKLGKIIE